MRRSFALLLLLPAIAAASAPVPEPQTIEQALAQSTAEANAAAAEVDRLEALAAQATDEAARLRAQQAAAAQAIAAAEARISAAEARSRLITAYLARQKQRLAAQQAPARSLLAGLAMMANRPPLLAIADSGSAEEFVRVRLLLDATLPVIRQRTAALSGEVIRARRLELALASATASLAARRNELVKRQQEFANLERQALGLAERHGSEALSAGDVALASSEESERLGGEVSQASAGRRLAAELARLGTAPARPFTARSPAPRAPFAYRLPAPVPVLAGFGEVNDAGIRTRGLTLATYRGQPLATPAAGTIRFAGPYRSQNGVLIVDHGGGWMSLILNAATGRRVGEEVGAGAPLGHALGPISVELSQNGRHVSPALIAGSSASLSKDGKTS